MYRQFSPLAFPRTGHLGTMETNCKEYFDIKKQTVKNFFDTENKLYRFFGISSEAVWTELKKN